MTGNTALERPGRRGLLPAVIVTTVAAAVILGQALLASSSRPAGTDPVFPSLVAPYSWFTPMQSSSPMERAVVIYQNGVGVEFMDFPQAVMIGADGSTYRRLDAAESLTSPADQGDPAASVLSADGTFVVVAGATRNGVIDVTTLADNSRRSVPIGEGRSAIPVSINKDGSTVLLLLSDNNMSPLTDANFQLHGMLGRLDLGTGELTEYADLNDVNSAALSPDGSRIAADTAEGIVLLDTSDGRITTTELARGGTHLDGDAWSPDGESFAFIGEKGLHVVDASTAELAQSTVSLPGVDYASAIGWRDDTTALVSTGLGDGENKSRFSWVHVDSRTVEDFSAYSPDGFTGASLGGADVASDLVATWQVQDRPADRGFVPIAFTLPIAVLLGLIVWRFTPRRPRRDPDLSAFDTIRP